MGRRHHAALLLDGRGGRNCFPSPFHLPIIGASLLLLLILAPQNSATAGHVTRSVTFNRTAVADRINNPADAFLRAFAEKEMSFAREAETPASSQDDWASEAAREFGEEYSSVTRREDVKGNDTAFAQARGRSMRLVRGKRGCSLTTGSWVLDNNRPAYDESTCPHLKEVATTTNCLGSRYSRPDRNWMRYSWKAHECGAQPLRFDARNFLEKMRNKNILFAGDSLMWEGFFPSFLCQVHRASPARKVNYDSRFKQTTWTVDEYKVTLIHVWSPFLMDFSSDSRVLERLKVQHPALGDTAVNLFQPDPNWTLLLPHVHLVLLQSATHWPNADKWLRRFFTDRKWQLLARQPDTFEAYTGAMNAVRERLSRKPSSKGGRYVAYFLSAPPRLAGCQNTVTLSPPEQVAYLRSKNAQSKIWFRTQKQLFGRKNSRVRFLDITHPSLARADAMIGSQGKASMDCLHPCLPGLPDNWCDSGNCSMSSQLCVLTVALYLSCQRHQARVRRARDEQLELEREERELQRLAEQQQQLDPQEQQSQQQQSQQQPLPPPVSGLRALGLPSPSPPSSASPPVYGPTFPPPDSSLAVFPSSPPLSSSPPSRSWATRRSPRARPSSPVPFTDLRTAFLRSSPPRPSQSVLPSPPESALTVSLPTPVTDYYRMYRPVLSRVLASLVTHPRVSVSSVSALTAAVTDFASTRRLDYATTLVTAPPTSPLVVGGVSALGCDALEDRQFELEFLAAAFPHLCAMLLAPEGDPNAFDIPTPRTYAEAVSGPWASQWRAAMDAEMASYRSTGTYVDEVPPPGANVVDGMWIYRVKRPPGSPPVFKARYVARGFSQREGVNFFQTFAPTPKMTTLRVLLHVAAQRDYELHSLDFSTAFLQGSLHEELMLRWREVRASPEA
ncbi:unnamed protein product [Closterium sp. NIES-53]